MWIKLTGFSGIRKKTDGRFCPDHDELFGIRYLLDCLFREVAQTLYCTSSFTPGQVRDKRIAENPRPGCLGDLVCQLQTEFAQCHVRHQHNRRFAIGEPVKVRIASVNLDERKMDFDLLSGGSTGKRSLRERLQAGDVPAPKKPSGKKPAGRGKPAPSTRRRRT